MTEIKSLLRDELAEMLSGLGQPAFRAGQVFAWLHRGVGSYEEMSDLPKSLRLRLSEEFLLTRPGAACVRRSSDGTSKYLWTLHDGESIECVLIPYKHGNSVCISTQAGCRMGCAFCASTHAGYRRDLSPGEMLDQYMFTAKDAGVKISNIVLMGIGEGLDNYDNVVRFLRIISHPDGINLGLRHISLSTCGICDKIDKLADERLGVTLSVSLHAANDSTRSMLMPVNRKYPLTELISVCRRYFEKTGRRISFEYAMIEGVNDSTADAGQLAGLLRGFPCHVNLIPLNAVPGSELHPSSLAVVRRFRERLESEGINVTVRRKLGSDIEAACGQLRRQNDK